MQINKINTVKPFSSNKKSKKQNNNDNKCIKPVIYTTLGIATLGAITYSIINSKPKNIEKETKTFLQNYKLEEQFKINNKISKFKKLLSSKFIDGIEDFYAHASAYKNNFKEITNIINISGIPEEKRGTLTKLLAASVSENYRHIKYKDDNFELVQKSINSMPERTYVYFENFKEFLDNRGKIPEKINIFTSSQDSVIKLSSNQNLNLTLDINAYPHIIKPKQIPNSDKIYNTLVKKLSDEYEAKKTLNNALLCNEGCKLKLDDNFSKDEIKNLLDLLSKELDTKHFVVTSNTLEKDLINIENFENSTGRKSIIFFDNKKEPELLKNLKNLNNILISKNLEDYDCTIITPLGEAVDSALTQIYNKLDNIKNLHFSDVTLLKHNLLNPLLIKNSNGNYLSPINGFILTGDNNTTQKALQQVSFITELPIITIDFTDFEKGIQNCVKELETANGKKLYDLINTEHVLCDYKDNLDKIILLGRFKNLMETTMAKYDGTGVLRTNTPLDNFEPASIADHRFNVTLETKE